MIKTLHNIEPKDIKEYEVNVLERIIENLRIHFYTKTQMQVVDEDYYFLKTAEKPRNQQVRMKDNIVMRQPIFKVVIGYNTSEEFITKERVKNFIDANFTILRSLWEKENVCKNDNDLDRRKKKYLV